MESVNNSDMEIKCSNCNNNMIVDSITDSYPDEIYEFICQKCKNTESIIINLNDDDEYIL